MGSNDIPPPHVPASYLAITNGFLQAGGALWTLCYILSALQSFKDRSYGTPLFVLAISFSWEIVYALYVAEAPLERAVFGIWMVLDVFLVIGVLKFGHYEWSHSPFVANNLKWVFMAMVGWCVLAEWTFAKWWIDNEIGKKEGKFYGGVVAADSTELGFWSAATVQTYLSVASLAQLLVRQHTGGVSWGIWATRTLGTLLGLLLNYGWMWYFWNEAHEYFMSPFAVLLWATALVCDVVYPFIFAQIRKSEKVLEDGRKIAGVRDFVEDKKDL